ncbi:hypothetical protein [Saliniramus sp.]|uniref:hypothetical protein n=1 Tax=Saliniramus sp. TaxID=2986772 RepID=UPI002D1CCD99|nr:hypothetical protein [Saliniramus sp.]HMB09003.1 hypothetical protein [Saliniramus sp.]
MAIPQLVRFDNPMGDDGIEPTLLIKGTTLSLKYIILGARMQLWFSVQNQRLIYAVKVLDDAPNGAIFWSVMEREQEKEALWQFSHGKPLVGFLFNELAVNLAWKYFSSSVVPKELYAWIETALLGKFDYEQMRDAVDDQLSKLHDPSFRDSRWIKLDLFNDKKWESVQNSLITIGASASVIDIFSQDEGFHQEQLGVWLTDSLHFPGVHHSPTLQDGEQTRELTDLLLSYDEAAFLIESKTISILARDKLPNRKKLERDVDKHLGKAFRQLRGAIRSLKSGAPVLNKRGDPLEIERDKPPHAIVLVPDLSLIRNFGAYDRNFINQFVQETKSFPHILDISELLRVVQAAEIIAQKYDQIEAMQSFDYYLFKRYETALNADTLCIEVLLRLSSDE